MAGSGCLTRHGSRDESRQMNLPVCIGHGIYHASMLAINSHSNGNDIELKSANRAKVCRADVGRHGCSRKRVTDSQETLLWINKRPSEAVYRNDYSFMLFI